MLFTLFYLALIHILLAATFGPDLPITVSDHHHSSATTTDFGSHYSVHFLSQGCRPVAG
jgi:hypothetical protein